MLLLRVLLSKEGGGLGRGGWQLSPSQLVIGHGGHHVVVLLLLLLLLLLLHVQLHVGGQLGSLGQLSANASVGPHLANLLLLLLLLLGRQDCGHAGAGFVWRVVGKSAKTIKHYCMNCNLRAHLDYVTQRYHIGHMTI